MFRSVFLKDLRDQRRSVAGWGVGILVMTAVMAWVWPSVRDFPNFDEFIAAYPEPMRELFNIESMTTGVGFLNAELFSIMLPLAFIIFGISRGARLIAGEEEAGTLEVVITTGLPRIRLLLEKAAALVASLVALAAITFASTYLLAAVVDMGVGLSDAAVGTMSVLLLGIEFGLAALAVGAVTGKRSWAMGAGIGVAVAAYLLYLVGALVSSVEPWRIASPFHQALEAGPLGGGWTGGMIWMVVVAVAVTVASLRPFDRRDIAIG